MKPYAGSELDLHRGLRKKDREEHLVSGVLSRLGFEEFKLSLHEHPDVIVDFSRKGHRVRLACEVQEIHSDDTSAGSKLRQFRGRWISIMEEVFALMGSDGTLIPYCVVEFLDHSYDCLGSASNASLVNDFLIAGKNLKTAQSIEFPQAAMPILSALVKRISVRESNGGGMLWWPSHMQSGAVPPIDGAIIAAVQAKGKLAASFDWRGAEEKWLLLVAEAHGLTGIIRR